MEKSEIISKYISYVSEQGEKPKNEYIFAKHLKITETTFYTYFPSLNALEQQLWLHTIDNTLTRLHTDQNYEGYSAREKLLSFYYTYVEELNQHRSFYKQLLKLDIPNLKSTPSQFKSIRDKYLGYVNGLLEEAKSNGEVKSRLFVDKTYGDLLFLQFLFVLKYWDGDQSQGFEKTDAAIEKAVNLSFEALSSNLIDSFFDFAKFIIKK